MNRETPNIGGSSIRAECGSTEPTFKSLNVPDAENPTEMGKNDDGSAAGTTNSMEPLQRAHKVKTQELDLQNRMVIMILNIQITCGWTDQ